MKKSVLSIVLAAGLLGGCAESAGTFEPKETKEDAPIVIVAPKKEEPVEATDNEPKELSLEETIRDYLDNRKLYEFGDTEGSYTVSTQLMSYAGPVTASADALEIAKIISMHDDFNSDYVTITFTKIVPDEYGNNNEETVFIATFSNIALEKIDIANVDNVNVANIADEYFVSPAIEF